MVKTDENIKRIGAILTNPKLPLKQRFRALFSLKNAGGSLAIEYISKAFEDSSALLKHELAYCLGQMKNGTAIPVLVGVLNDKTQEAIVRHEAAEALGAIGDPAATDVLKDHLLDDSQEVAETCQLALKRILWLQNTNNANSENIYHSVDPAPPLKEVHEVETLQRILMNKSESMFERYRAMFALRDLRTPESALALTVGLKTDSALFSHEIAFVLGQLQDKITVPALIDCLEDTYQNEMVRHECAEALGAIGSEECYEVLKKFLDDEKRVVRESCEIALDMCDYETSDELQYALV